MLEWVKSQVFTLSVVDIVTILCAIGSFISYLGAKKEKREAKEISDMTKKYYQSEVLSRLQDRIVQSIKENNGRIYRLSAPQLKEQYAGYSISDIETVLSCLEKQGTLVCDNANEQIKEYYINNNAYKLNCSLEEGTFSF